MGAAVTSLNMRAAGAEEGADLACKDDALGPLSDAADLTDGEFRLALPAGWTYRSVGQTGSIMSDGIPTPGRNDGMAAFWGPNGNIYYTSTNGGGDRKTAVQQPLLQSDSGQLRHNLRMDTGQLIDNLTMDRSHIICQWTAQT